MSKLFISGLRAYKVADGFLAGSYPGGSSDGRMKLESLFQHGVSVFINLMEPGEHYRYDATLREYNEVLPGDTQTRDAADTTDTAPRMLRFPIRDMAVPDPVFMKRILNVIDDQLEQGKSVYIHCLGGVGRTGTVVGCWLVRHGFAEGESALHELDRLREFDPLLDLPSPQTEAQRQMIRTWSAGE